MIRNKNWMCKMKVTTACVDEMCDQEDGRFCILMAITTLTQP